MAPKWLQNGMDFSSRLLLQEEQALQLDGHLWDVLLDRCMDVSPAVRLRLYTLLPLGSRPHVDNLPSNDLLRSREPHRGRFEVHPATQPEAGAGATAGLGRSQSFGAAAIRGRATTLRWSSR